MPQETKNITTPFDPASIDVEKKNMSVNSLITMLEGDMIDLEPAFQRKGDLWPETKQSQLIESLLLKLPLPSMYLEYDPKRKKYIVIDGLQRLCALKNFAVDRTLRLTGLEFLQKEYEGAMYSQLSFTEKIEIGLQEISVNVLKGTTPPSAKFIIFKRINSAGTPLNNQEIRNALYSGHATKMLHDLSEDEVVKSVGFKPRRLQDQEMILRFMAFMTKGYDSYNGRMAPFLNDCLLSMESMPPERRSELAQLLFTGIERNGIIFGQMMFRNPGRRSGLPSSSLFDVMTVSFARLSDIEFSTLQQRRDEFVADMNRMITDDPLFAEAIGSRSDRRGATRYRYEQVWQLINKYIKG